jgi:uncharacterized membrane protein (DUF485 family)
MQVSSEATRIYSNPTNEGCVEANIQEYRLNYNFLSVVSLGGILPIIYTLAFLHIAKKRSWYIFTLTLLAIAVSVATLVRTSNFNNPNMDELLNKEHSIPNCGIRDPTMFCSYEISWDFSIKNMALGPYPGAGATLVISLLVFGLLCLDQIRIHRLPAFQRILTQCTWLSREPDYAELNHQKKGRRRPFQVLLWVLYFAVWALYIFVFAAYFSLLRLMPMSTAWTFGQIVAITVWVPVLFEYGNLEVCKCSLESKTVLPSWQELGSFQVLG